MFSNNKTFSVNGIYVDYLYKRNNAGKADNPKKEKETEKLFHDLEELIRNARISGGSFDYSLLNGNKMDMAFMFISREGIWASLLPGGICSKGITPRGLSFAHAQMRDVRVFFVENPYEGKIYVIFSSKKEVRIASITSWGEDFDFNKRDAVNHFYWNHYDDSPKTMAEVLRFLEHKPWLMFRVCETTYTGTASKKRG